MLSAHIGKKNKSRTQKKKKSLTVVKNSLVNHHRLKTCIIYQKTFLPFIKGNFCILLWGF